MKIYLKPKGKETEIGVSGLTLKVKVNNVTASADTWSDFGENGEKMKLSELSINGTPINKWTIDAGMDGLNKELLEDVLVLLIYTAS